jgi:hypothetical protein
MQSTSDGKKIWKIKLKIGKRITKHMRVCWKHFVDEDFVPLVCWFDGLDHRQLNYSKTVKWDYIFGDAKVTRSTHYV